MDTCSRSRIFSVRVASFTAYTVHR